MKLSAPLFVLAFIVSTLDGARAQDGLIGHWLFDGSHAQGQFVDPIAGGPPVRIGGKAAIVEENGLSFLELPGRDTMARLSENLINQPLPKTGITVMGWARVDQGLEYGGLMGAIQDNGDFERGWLLGYNNSNFTFALASEGTRRMTYLAAETAYSKERWQHVAGTYDGKAMRIYVDGALSGESGQQKGAILYPPQAFYEIGAYHDDNEFFMMDGGVHELKVFSRALSAEEILADYQAKESLMPKAPKKQPYLEISAGPFIRWAARDEIVITWELPFDDYSEIRFQSPKGVVLRQGNEVQGRRHEARFKGLEKDAEYTYRITAGGLASKPYLFDSSFYYEPVRILDRFESADRQADRQADRSAIPAWTSRILEQTGIRRGYALVVDAVDGRIALELALNSDMQAIVLCGDPERAVAIRRSLDEAGVYGARVSVHEHDGGPLPYGPYFANLIVSEKTIYQGGVPGLPASELYRVLRPAGGALWLEYPGEDRDAKQWREGLRAWLNGADEECSTAFATGGAMRMVSTRRSLEGAGDWTHQYGGADNSSCSKDELVQGPMKALWWGDPGPRPMPDRGPRNPAPLSANGKLYIQGDRVLFGLDAYNGTVLWTLFNPEMRRANLIRDCSNMAASREGLYLAQAGYCFEIEGRTGNLNRRFEVPGFHEQREYVWGYAAVVESLLVGSAVRKGSQYLGDDGEWYENFSNEETGRVTSDALFGYDRRTGEQRWLYAEGAIINSTITIGDGVLYFIESMNPELREASQAAFPQEALTETRLVALDLNSGEKLWSREKDVSALQFMIYMVYGQDKLVVTGTDKDKNYHVYAFDAKGVTPAKRTDDKILSTPGSLVWQERHKEDKGHHSGHLQHPVVIGDTFYSDQRAFDLHTGETLRKDLPERRGCGTMSASMNSMFFRHYFHGMWNIDTDERTQFQGIRTGCWLGIIPAGGVVLAPESSAGCSCTHSIQTSVAYVPVSSDPTR